MELPPGSGASIVSGDSEKGKEGRQMAEDKRTETMIAAEEEREAVVILNFMRGLDGATLNNFHEFIKGVKYGMSLAEKKLAAVNEAS